MREIVFASNNLKKTEEIRTLLPQYRVLNLADIGCDVDIPETGSSFAENATLKSNYVFQHYGLDCFADDSGLEVKALNWEPGIYSARYSGTRGDVVNMNYLLQKMNGISDRTAQFKTVISFVQGGEVLLFEGLIKGNLLQEPRGEGGFGYDPIFVPLGYDQTFAEMSLEEKNKISHRALAMQKLIQYLQK